MTVRSEQKVEVTEEQTVLLSMRSKSQSRKRKLEPVLEHGQEEQSTGNVIDFKKIIREIIPKDLLFSFNANLTRNKSRIEICGMELNTRVWCWI